MKSTTSSIILLVVLLCSIFLCFASGQSGGRCPLSSQLQTGTSNGAFYTTLSPFEHFDSTRSQLFPNTCTAKEIAGTENIKLSIRSSPENYSAAYNVLTREKDEIFVYGGYVALGNGAYLAKLNPETLQQLWRVPLKITGDQFNWPGVAAVHGNGYVYAIAGSILAKINPETSQTVTVNLPTHPNQRGAAYNGFVISPSGVIFAKSMERGQNCPQACDLVCGLECTARNRVPSFLVSVEPQNLTVLSYIELPEPVIGRIMTDRQGGVDYVYCAGATRVWRYVFGTDNQLSLDPTWGPFPYVIGLDGPGTSCGVLGDWIIVQTNFVASNSSLRVWAINKFDSNKNFSIQPFPNEYPSQEFSKPGLDTDNMRIFTSDQLVGKVTALDFSPNSGFTVRWKARQTMASFWALTGNAVEREIIGTDFSNGSDYVVWREGSTGREIVRSPAVDKQANGDIVSPGFDGKFYYLAQINQKLVELTPVAAQQQPPVVPCSQGSRTVINLNFGGMFR